MASADMTPSTPPPPHSVRTPSAPRLGFHDSWEPFSPRKSARLSSQRAAARTPSPPPLRRQPPASPRTARKCSSQSSAAMVSPISSPRKKRTVASDSTRRVSSSLTSESTTNAAAALGFKNKPVEKSATASISRSTGMLPTPSKTPQKPPNAKTVANIQSFARNLFPSEETAVASPRKKRAVKKYSGITMESFRAEDVEDPIEIFTDSQDRIPTKDESESNPFYGNNAQPESPKRRSKRRQVMIAGEGPQSIEDASRREDGMVYVFRGKKFFRKFSENEDEEAEELGSDVETHISRPLTRSSIKPRLLFPSQKTKEMLEEEEAATDVEDLHMSDAEKNPQTPIKAKHERAQTPEAPRFAPVSPPDTKRTTRSTNKLAEASTPMKRTGKRSPFDSWPRTKEHKAQAGTKRSGEALASTNAKRTRA